MTKKVAFNFILLTATMFLLGSCATQNDITRDDKLKGAIALEKDIVTPFKNEYMDYTEDDASKGGQDEESELLVEIIKQHIAENMEEFTFEFHYVMEFFSEWDNNKSPMIKTIIVRNQSGKVIQTLDLSNINAHIGEVSFADINFDGFLDLSLIRAQFESILRWGIGWSTYYFVWNNDKRQFGIHNQLLELQDYGFFRATEDFRNDEEIWEPGNSWKTFDEGLQLLVFEEALSGSWFYFPPLERSIPHWHIRQYYQYIDGEYVLIRIQEMLFDWEGTWQVRDLDVTAGIETVTYISDPNDDFHPMNPRS